MHVPLVMCYHSATNTLMTFDEDSEFRWGRVGSVRQVTETMELSGSLEAA